MIKSQHVSNDDLLELINGEGESDKTRTIGNHIHECEQCRNALDELTAQSAIWEMAPVLLKDRHVEDSVANMPGDHERTQDFTPAASKVTDEPVWQYPIDELLEPPKHPEMMGRIGKYDIEREVGRGGMGVVLKAHDVELNRPLAIKILAPHLASHGTARKRFAQEAIAAAGVLHPNVIAVHGVNNEGKTPYIVMPYVAGPSLQALVEQQGPLSEIEIVRIGLQISSGLAAAHSQGLVHRDIKPANILVEADVNRVLITDFGLARAEDDASLTRTGWLTGTPNYMSPEQTRGERPDQRSDLFSLGSLVYFLATGRLPFRSETPLGVLSRIQNEDPTPVRQVNNQISSTLADVIDMLLAKNPDDRFQSSAELHEILEKHVAYLHQPDISKPPQVKKDTGRKTRFGVSQILAGLLAMACIALAAMAWSGAFDLDQSAGEKKTPYSPEYDDTFFAKYETPISDEPEEYFEVGIEMLKTGEIDRAIKAFENAEEAGHDKASVQYNLGCCWAKKADKDKAFSYFNRAIDNGYLNTEHFLVDEDLISLRSDKRFDNAASRMDAIINADEFVAAGIEEANNQRFEQAVILQQQALKLVPEHEKAVLNLGYAFHMLGKYDKAIKWHKKAAASDQYAALGNYNLSCIHSQRNELDLAIKHFDTAVDRKLSRNLDRDSIVADTDLDNLRGDVRFAASMKKFQDSEHRLKHTHTMSFNRGYGSIVTSATSSDYDPELLYVSGPVNGTWNGDIKGGTIQLSILRSIEGSDCRWGYLDNYNLDQFTPEISESLNKFSLIKPQGTIEFVGNFNNQNGSGKFKFQGDDDYQAQLASKGIESITEALLFRLFFSRDNEQKVLADLQELQNLDLDEETRQVLMIAGIPTGLVKEYQEADLDVKQHLRFILTRVHCRMILEYNRAKLDLDDHKEFIDQRVPASLLVSYTDAGLDLEGHSNFIASRVDAKFLKEYKDAGLSLNRFNGFINQRVSARFLKSYLDAGFDLDRFQNFINWRVEPKFLESYIEKGLEPEKYSKFINQRVPAATLGGYLDGELSLKTYGSFVKNHVPADLVLSYKKAGFDPIKYKWFIQQRIESRFLARYQAAGLDIEEHREFIRDRVEPAKILRFRKSRSKKK